ADLDKHINQWLSSVRIRVEHAIGGVKRYRIVKDKIRNWKRGFKDAVFETCCGLHNFRLNFRPWQYDPIQLHLFTPFLHPLNILGNVGRNGIPTAGLSIRLTIVPQLFEKIPF
ncbi:MAG: transposase family protein, partial [Chloroflexi bacterium]|nr:transposase family protein [Chloroflexota bacterium]